MTFSILGHDPQSGETGIAVQSKFPGVGGIAMHGRVEAGVISTQAFANPDHGSRGLDLLALEASAEQVLDILLNDDSNANERQLAVMDRNGAYRAHTGKAVLGWDGWAGYRGGTDCLAHGNSLTSEAVVERMVATFELAQGDLATRLIEGLRAGQAAGGEIRGQQSAAILVLKDGGGYGGRGGRHVDISIYDHKTPIEELWRCYGLHRLSYFPSDQANLIEIDTGLANELRAMLVTRGFLKAPDAGPWNSADIIAMQRFMGTENYDNRIRDDALIDTEVLADIRKKHNADV